MTLIRYNPCLELNAIQRLFEETRVPFERDFVKVPAAELTQTDDAVYLKLELPGMDAKDLDIQVTENAVSISGERKSETKTEEKGITRTEFHYGKFQRVIPLEVKVQNTNVKAEYKDGILNLTLPKKEEEKNKVVKVNLEQLAA
ncbi:Hsp20 family protein [Scytonema sp. UIC 10036]|uniref:Hsp20/alpha crystallin family protein n=1 Tax=Scytonema sp. UIC 10036 TaxID=2304196 RepID=UPI0012DA5D64|nr:Hsp20/alpha crystallin family protein [Scytonema sp. UIC 10036]MUG91791.1 Hsp20 family protein [Scytonema sp. UIC 10036]